MEMDQFAKQTVGFQKTTFNHAIDLMTSMHEQAEKFTKSWANKNGWMPEQNLKIMTQWCDACKNGLQEYKKLMNDAFDTMASFVMAVPMPMEAVSGKSKGEEKPASKKETKKEAETEKEKAK